MSITTKLLSKDRENKVLVQCYVSKELATSVKDKMKKLNKKVSISSLVRASLETFLEEKVK